MLSVLLLFCYFLLIAKLKLSLRLINKQNKRHILTGPEPPISVKAQPILTKFSGFDSGMIRDPLNKKLTTLAN